MSVPDQLWRMVASDDDSPSEVVQRALWNLVERFEGDPDEAAPAEVIDGRRRMEAVRERLVYEATAAYSRGFVVGIETANQLSWEALAVLARAGARVLEPFSWPDDSPYQSQFWGVRERFAPLTPTEQHAALDAIRELYRTVCRDVPGLAGGVDPSGGSVPVTGRGTARFRRGAEAARRAAEEFEAMDVERTQALGEEASQALAEERAQAMEDGDEP